MTITKRSLFLLLIALLLLALALPGVFAQGSETVLVESGKTLWHYYVTDATGYAAMDKGWYKSEYDVSLWKVGVSPFGDRLPGGTDSLWQGNDHAIFLKTTFTVESIPEDRVLLFKMFYDNTAKIYLNDSLIFEDNGWNDATETFAFSADALKVGTNTLSVSLLDDVGGREFDLTATLGVKSAAEATTVQPPITPPENTDTLLVNKDATVWRYYVTTTEGFSMMDAAWKTADYDHTAWKTKVAPFGDCINAKNAQETNWQGDNHGIFLVTTFTVDDLSVYQSLYYYFDLYYDNTLVMYLNGEEIFRQDRWNSSHERMIPSQKRVREALRVGENLLAVSLLDDAGGREFSLSFAASESEILADTVVSEEELQKAGLPVIRIDTDSGDYITSRLTYVDATMQIDNLINYAEEDNLYTEKGGASIEIRGRGNSTWNNGYRDGKPGTLPGDTHTRKVGYNIKLEEKTNFFGMGVSKKWVLLANYMDRSNLRNRLIADLSGRMGMIYTQSVYVNLVLNGEYMGVYALTEKVDIDLFEGAVTDFEDYAEAFAKAIAKEKGYTKDWRSAMEDELCENLSWLTEARYTAKDGKVYTVSDYIDLSEVSTKTGYIIEYDGYNDEPSFFHTAHGVPLKVSNLEYIKSNPTVFEDLRGYFAEFEEALFSDDFYNSRGKHYSEYVDMDSFVDYFILNALILNVEFGYKSMYMSIRADGKIYLGPTWDYDWSSGNRFLGANGEYNKWYNDGRAGNNHWYRQAYGDPYFVSLVKERWASLKPAIEDMIASMDYYEDYLMASSVIEYCKFSADPYESDFKGRTGGRSFSDEVSQLRTFLINRFHWMDSQLQLRDPDIEGFGFESRAMTLTLSGESLAKENGAFDYKATARDGYLVLKGTLNASRAKVFLNGILLEEINTSSGPYLECEIDFAALEKGVNTVMVIAYDASGAITAQSYRTVVLPGIKRDAPTKGSFLPEASPSEPEDDGIIRLSTDTLFSYIQKKDSENGTVALRSVFVGDIAYLSRFAYLDIVVIFDTTEGKKTFNGTLGHSDDYGLFEKITAYGDVYMADEGDYLFGNEFYGIPAGILKSISVIATSPDGTVLYTGSASFR